MHVLDIDNWFDINTTQSSDNLEGSMRNASSTRIRWAASLAAVFAFALGAFAFQASAQAPATPQTTAQPAAAQAPNPTYVASEADRQKMMDLLGIKTLRLGP